MTGKLGTLAPGACADLLVLDGDPLDDITVLERHESIRVIVRGGRICKNDLN
jgi:imidazolonepropionase-like amidohydrolase